MLAYLFPGQGSQSRGMGATLFDEFSELVQRADSLLGYSIKTLCLEDPHQQLSKTQFTQPAIFIVSVLSYLKKIRENKPKPDFVAGHSLGEYSALFAAEVFDFETGIKLVKKRGELMSQAQGGAMAAVIGLNKNEIEEILTQNNLDKIKIANYNTYTQFILSGLQTDIEQAQTIFAKRASYIPLKVSGAFHSDFMSQAQKEFTQYLIKFDFNIPRLPVLANTNGKPYHPAIITQNLADQITQSVQWTETIEYLLSHTGMTFEEVGPGNVLIGLLNRIKNKQ